MEVSEKTVFVTVGTTLFDALIEAVDTDDFKQVLLDKGYTRLVIQLGKGNYVPQQESGDVQRGVLAVEHFRFSPSLADHMRAASLVISHAGSGSIFEALRANRPLVVVANEALMDNHQRELADELAARRHLYCASPALLAAVVQSVRPDELEPYPPAEAQKFAIALDRFLGFGAPC